MEENDTEHIEELKTIANHFVQSTALIAIGSFIFAFVYTIIFCCINNIKQCIMDTATATPLFVLIVSSIEGGRTMWAEYRKEKFREEGRTEGSIEQKDKTVAILKEKGVDNEIIKIVEGITVKPSGGTTITEVAPTIEGTNVGPSGHTTPNDSTEEK